MMGDILQDIVACKKEEVRRFRQTLPDREIHAMAERDMERGDGAERPSMRKAVMDSATGIIAEFKRKSPSAGWINRDARADKVPHDYEHNGAAALSILTDSRFFGGCDGNVGEALASGVTLPVLYKNFIVDEYQLFRRVLAGLRLCCSSLRCSLWTRAARLRVWHAISDWRSCLRCTPPASWNMPTATLTCSE